MTIRFDEQGFGTDAGKIRWEEVVALGIRTTADGPFSEDVYFQFLLRDGYLELPGTMITGADVDVIQTRLAGTDSRKIVVAMGSTKERIFRLWHIEESKSRWDIAVYRSRFAALVGRLGGVASGADAAFERLRIAWGDGDRRYHDLEHLTDCLRELDGAGADAGVADISELALWYHDAIYQPPLRDSEDRSAALLLKDGAGMNIPERPLQLAAACIRATAHLAGPAASEPASDLVIDVDLSILGRDALRFMEFEYAVEEEYASVPRLRYFLTRGRFLASLLDSPSIFRTDHFRDRYEAKARANISALLRSPRYRAHRWVGRFCGSFT